MKKKLMILCITLWTIGWSYAQKNPGYAIEEIPMPEGLDPETGGIDFFPDGRLVACFTRGEVLIYDPNTGKWSVFAEGLHEPLGLLVENESEIIVLQRPELTRIKDTDGDGKADLYETITDSFGLSGNYHEFNYGPVKDKAGNYYIALNTASSGAGFRDNPRGPVNLAGRDSTSGRKQMYSVVPYRGWVLKVTPDGEVIPYSSGLRSPNGIGFDEEGNLFVNDNQSDWVETSKFFHIREGHFYGHPASLVWEKDWDGRNPFRMPIEELDRRRTEAAVFFPHGIMANSPAQPLYVRKGTQFPQFEGQWLIGEMNHERIVRVMLEKVNGEFQGACVPFQDREGLRMGNNRLAFGPDGSLYTGQIIHGWAGAKGIQRISAIGKEAPMDIQNMKLLPTGFEFTFTQPVDEKSARDRAGYLVRHYRYPYQKKPFNEPIDFSNQENVQEIAVKNVVLSADRKKVSVELPLMKKGYVYEFKLEGIRSSTGAPLMNKLICYSANQLLGRE